MTLDGLSIAALVAELAPLLSGAKIEKINMPAKDEIVLLLHTKEGKKRLALSASGGEARIHLTAQQKANPDRAFNFCMFLRKYLSGGRIESICQIGLERVVHMAIAAKDEMGIPCSYKLCIEIMGKYSNIILVHESGKVMDSIKHISVDTSSKRQVLPGVSYDLPPMDKTNPLEAEPGRLPRVSREGGSLTGWWRRWRAFPRRRRRSFARGFCPSASDAGARPGSGIFCILRNYLENALAHPVPCTDKYGGRTGISLPVPYLAYSEKNRKSFAAMNEAVDYYYAQRDYLQKLTQRKQALQKCSKRTSLGWKRSSSTNGRRYRPRKRPTHFASTGSLFQRTFTS